MACAAGLGLRVLVVSVMLRWVVHCEDAYSHCGAYSQGDVVIAILASVHSEVKDLQTRVPPDAYACQKLDLIPFVESLAAIHTIETINNSSFLPGITLGYVVCDPCVYASKALECVQHMLAVNGSPAPLANYSDFRPPVRAFIGERYSELSFPVAKLLSLYMIPQISCSSSAAALSDKLRYASFFRVIPSDVYQTKALSKFMKHYSWTWVGVVTLDDEYGTSALESFLTYAKKDHICTDFQIILPHYLGAVTKETITDVADRIQDSNCTVVLLILRPEQVELLFNEMIKRSISRTWIASDAWSTTRFLMTLKDINKVGDIFGFTFMSGNIPGIEDYLRNLRPSPGARNDFIREYKEMRFSCDQTSALTSSLACNFLDPQNGNDDYLIQQVDLTEAYSQRVAVYAIAHAIRKLLKCTSTACSGEPNFPAWKIINILRNLKFSVDEQNYSFDQSGDFENGYNLIMWKNADGNRRELSVVGQFLISADNVTVDEEKVTWFNLTVQKSACSNPCRPGTHKQISAKETCCYECVLCNEGHFSDQYDMDDCRPCPNSTTSEKGATECTEVQIIFLKWSAGQSIVVMVATLLGLLLLGFSFISFIKNRKLIQERDLIFYCLMKLGLIISFISVITFLGDPTNYHCEAQQVMHALGYTLCICCIFVMAFKLFLGVMSISPNSHRLMERFDKPFTIIIILTSVQVLNCILWIRFDPPKVVERRTNILIIYRLCTQHNWVGFGFMHVYILVLALGCFLLAFKGRSQDSNPIIFSMLFNVLVWLCLFPIFITQLEQRPIVQVSAIMVSNYVIIISHFLPKWIHMVSDRNNDDQELVSGDGNDSREETLPPTPIPLYPQILYFPGDPQNQEEE